MSQQLIDERWIDEFIEVSKNKKGEYEFLFTFNGHVTKPEKGKKFKECHLSETGKKMLREQLEKQPSSV